MSREVIRLPGAILVVLGPLWVVASRGVAMAHGVAVVTAFAVAALAVYRLARGARIGRTHAALAALVGWSAVSAVIRPVAPDQAAWLVASGVVALTLAIVVSHPREGAAGRLAVVIAGTLVALWLLGERLALTHRPGGPFADPNLDATAIVLALALVPTIRMPKAVAAALVGVGLAGVVSSTSRAGLLAAMALALYWLARAGSRRVRVGVAIMVVVAGAGLAARVLTDRDPLRWERVRIWRVAVRTIVAEAPLGAGPGGFRDAAIPHNFAREGEFARFSRLPSLAECDVLQVAGSLGLPGLVLAVWLGALLVRAARAGTANPGALVVVAVTSAFHSQLAVPVIAWLAAIAVFASLGRVRGRAVRSRGPAPVVVALALAGAASLALSWPAQGLFPPSPRVVAEGRRALAARWDDDRLASAEAAVWSVVHREPRSGELWRLLGELRLRRAEIRRDPQLAVAAREAWQSAAALDRNDVWAQFGLGRSESLLGRRAGAAEALRRAVEIEPNCVPAWLELARTDVELGRMSDARRALERADHILHEVRGRRFVSDYERAMATPDPWLLAMLRNALKVSR